MGCSCSASASEATDPQMGGSRTNSTKYAVETFQRRKVRVAHSPRRGLVVPDSVIAPSLIAADIGTKAYRSMHSSPKGKLSKFRPSYDEDEDGPPNHETYKEYIEYFDTFMWDVKVRPQQLTERVAKLRRAMVTASLPCIA